MSKAKKGSIENPVSSSDLAKIIGGIFRPSIEDRTYVIKSAKIKDDFCNYSFEITSGVGLGDVHGVKGHGIIDDDLQNAVKQLNVHMAIMDEIFEHSKIEFDSINAVKTHEFTLLYNVTEVKITGSEGDESIELTGTKYIRSLGGRAQITLPKVDLSKLSPYKYFNELKYASDYLRDEVCLYKEGKYTAVEEDEDKPDPKQTSILDNIGDSDDEFDKAKV